MRTKKKRKSVRRLPAPNPLDIEIRELSEKIDWLWQSAHDGLEELLELLRILKEERKRVRYAIVPPEYYPPLPLWIETSRDQPLANPQCTDRLFPAMSMA